MNIEKAKRYLEKLRAWTEARGATASEAVQAAELAEKIAERYGLDASEDADIEARIQLRYRRCPKWCVVLASAIGVRFQVEACGLRGGGLPCEVMFVGAPHRANVAAWLFRSVRNEIERSAVMAAGANDMRGGDLVRFRNQFCYVAALKIHSRLNPVSDARKLELQRQVEKENERPSRRRRSAKSLAKQSKPFDMTAHRLGMEAGKAVPLDDNALPDQSSEPKRIAEVNQ